MTIFHRRGHTGTIPQGHGCVWRDRPQHHIELLGIQMMFRFMLVDDEQPLCLCKHYQKVFLDRRSNAAFYSARCKNQYSVYKRHEKSERETG